MTARTYIDLTAREFSLLRGLTSPGGHASPEREVQTAYERLTTVDRCAHPERARIPLAKRARTTFDPARNWRHIGYECTACGAVILAMRGELHKRETP